VARKEEKVVSKYISKIDRAEQWQSNQVSKWNKTYRAFIGDKPSIDKRRSNIHIPVLFTAIRTVLTRILFALFSHAPYVKTLDYKDPDSRLLERIANYYVGKIDFIAKYEFVLNSLLYGLGIMKIIRKVEDEMFVPKARVINPWDFYFDVDAYSLDDITWVGHRMEVHISYIEENIKNKIYRKVDLKKLKGSVTNTNDVIANNKTYSLTDNEDYVEVIELYDIPNKKKIVLGNRSVVLAYEDHEDPIPYVLVNAYPIAGDVLGLSDAELIIDLQREINAKRNQRLDNVNRLLNQMFFIYSDANIKNMKPLVRPVPGAFVIGDRKPEPLVVPDLTQSLVLEETRPFRDIERTLGVYDIVRGELSKKSESATEVLKVAESANMTFWLKTKFIEKAVVDLAIKLTKYAIKYSSVIRIGNEEIKLRKDKKFDLDKFSVTAVASSQVENEIIRRKQFVDFMALLMKFFPEDVDKKELLDMLLNVFGIEEKEKILKEKPTEEKGMSKEELFKQFMEKLKKAGAGEPQPAGMPISPQSLPPIPNAPPEAVPPSTAPPVPPPEFPARGGRE